MTARGSISLNNRLPRRDFLKLAAAGAAGAYAVPYFIPSGVLAADGKPGANERVTVGAIGVGGRATLLLNQLPEGVQIVALCDCNLPRAEKYKADHKASWPVLQHYQKLLERKDIDAVIVGTGEFQRVLPCIHACQAGKDIYAEKPLTVYIREGRVLVDTVRKHDRIFQVGTQQRSMAMNRIACELVRSGGLGKVLEVLRGSVYRQRAIPLAAVSRTGDPGGPRLGRVAQPSGLSPLQLGVDGLDALARLLRGRNDQLGRMASIKSSGPSAPTAPARSKCGR